MPPSLDALRARLLGRASDDEAVIRKRLDNAPGELACAPDFDYWIVNDDLDAAYDRLRAVYLAESLRPALNPGLLEAVLNGPRG
jgi:guanylate kinase